MPVKSTIDRCRRRLEDLKNGRSEYEAVFQALSDYFAPDRFRLNPQQTKGQKNRTKIVDSVGTYAMRVLKSGMHSGVTSPSRPWFKPTALDPGLKEYAPVQEYLNDMAQRMRVVIGGSNAYNQFHTSYGDLGLFGDDAMIMTFHPQNYVHLYGLVHGEYWLANDQWGMADTCYRRCDMTVSHIMTRFGDKGGVIPNFIKDAYAQGRNDEIHTVYNAIEPRWDRDPNSPHKSQKPMASNYWVDGQNSRSNELLEESGFDHNPILATRWEPVGNDPYSPGPGWETLPDVQMLQKEQTRKGEAIDKKVRPPMKGPSSMRNNPRSILPGSMTFVDDPNGAGYTPAMQVNFDIRELKEDIAEVRERVKEGWYANLFLMLQNMEGVQPRNVLELTQRKEEQLLQLGPVLERVYGEKLRPFLRFTQWQMIQARILKPPPKELMTGMGMEFTGTLAQAQKAVATGGIERLVGFIGSLGAGKPEAFDKLDADQAIDEYSDMIGSPPNIVVSDDKVAAVRAQRQQMQQQAMAVEQAAKVAPAANQGAQAAAVMAGADGGGGINAAQLLSSLGISG